MSKAMVNNLKRRYIKQAAKKKQQNMSPPPQPPPKKNQIRKTRKILDIGSIMWMQQHMRWDAMRCEAGALKKLKMDSIVRIFFALEHTLW